MRAAISPRTQLWHSLCARCSTVVMALATALAGLRAAIDSLADEFRSVPSPTNLGSAVGAVRDAARAEGHQAVRAQAKAIFELAGRLWVSAQAACACRRLSEHSSQAGVGAQNCWDKPGGAEGDPASLEEHRLSLCEHIWYALQACVCGRFGCELAS